MGFGWVGVGLQYCCGLTIMDLVGWLGRRWIPCGWFAAGGVCIRAVRGLGWTVSAGGVARAIFAIGAWVAGACQAEGRCEVWRVGKMCFCAGKFDGLRCVYVLGLV